MQAEEQTQTSTEVKPLGELLEYQDSSIVSRVLLKNNGRYARLEASGSALQRFAQTVRHDVEDAWWAQTR